jgi:hypothetical protein
MFLAIGQSPAGDTPLRELPADVAPVHHLFRRFGVILAHFSKSPIPAMMFSPSERSAFLILLWMFAGSFQ